MHISAMKKFFLFSSSLLLFYTAHNERTTRLCRDEIRQNDDKKAKTLTKHTFCKEGIHPVRVFKNGHLANIPLCLEWKKERGRRREDGGGSPERELVLWLFGLEGVSPLFHFPNQKGQGWVFHLWWWRWYNSVAFRVKIWGIAPQFKNCRPHIVIPSF